MKSLLWLQTSIIQEMGDAMGINPSHDVDYIVRRVSKEGDSFLTVTLPQFEADFLAALELGRVEPHMFPGFRTGRHGLLPKLFSGWTRLIFLPSGVQKEVDDNFPDVVRAIRQMTTLLKKVEIPVSVDKESSAIKRFIDTDKTLECIGCKIKLGFRRVSSVQDTFFHLFGDLFDKLEADIASFSLLPGHGPGAVAEKLSQRERRTSPQWFETIEDVFPSRHYLSYDTRGPSVPLIPEEQESHSRVVTVPKTQKSPRVIAIEPGCRQYVQQSLSRPMYGWLRKRYPGSLDLTDQGTNRAWAWYASQTRSHATVDLSEASDRLYWALVFQMLMRWPHVSDAFRAARTPTALLPDGSTRTLAKFATMGSALTFPMQSMIFTSIVVAAMRQNGHRVTRHTLHEYVSVFGDDIVMPSSEYSVAVDWLTSLGLKVNQSKSYVSGFFRESCGEEYFAGTDVSVVRLTKPLPKSRRDAQEIASLSSFRNRLYRYGYWKTASICDDFIATLIDWKPIPIEHNALGRETFLSVLPDRLSGSYQRDEIRRPTLRGILRDYQVDGREGLLDWFLEKERSRTLFTSGFAKSERPVSFEIQHRWLPL